MVALKAGDEMADGSITAVIEADDSAAQAELNKLEKKITNLQNKLSEQKYQRMPLADEAARLGAELDAANRKLYEMNNGSLSYTTEEIQRQAEYVNYLTAMYNKADGALERQDASIKKTGLSLEYAQEKAGGLAKRLIGSGDAGASAGAGISNAMQAAAKRIEKLENRIIGLARRVFVFTLITKALRGMREQLWLGIKANDQAAAAVARLKGALLTLAQPIIQTIIPAFVLLVNVLTKVVTTIADLFSRLTGKTLQQSADAAKALYGEQKALNGVGAAAKKAGKQLASFDEINKLSSETSDSPASGTSAAIAPAFDGIVSLGDEVLDSILDKAKLIGSALAAWKIGSKLLLGLPGILELFAAIYGTIKFIEVIFDMWENEITFPSLMGALGLLSVVATGLYLAFGKIAAAISLIVGGASLIITAFRDIDKNGVNLANTLTAIAGIIATGLGFSILAGSIIPLVIAAIAGVLLAIANLTGHGEELINGLKMIFEGFVSFFKHVFSGDMEAALEDLKKIWEGLKTAVIAVLSGIKDALLMLLQWVIDKVTGFFGWVIDKITGFGRSILERFKKVWSDIKNWWNRNVKKYFTAEYWAGLGKTIIDGLLNGMKSAWESVKSWGSSARDWLREKFSFGSTVSVEQQGAATRSATLSMDSVPHLAQGRVIPPNREFLAVLGDQRSGTNIETPLETMVQAMMIALRNANFGGNREIVLQLDRRELGRAVVDVSRLESQRAGVRIGGY